MADREIYLVLNSPVYTVGDVAEVYIVSSNTVEEKIDVDLRDYKGVLSRATLSIPRGTSIVYTLEFQTPRIPGRYELILYSDSIVLDRVKYIVIGDHEDTVERYIAFTWHHHQAPGYLPNGRYRYTWAFKHVFEDEVSPYGRGVYQYHSSILEKYPDYKCTYNLSPSLLAQWSQLINEGVVLENGSNISSSSSEAELVKDTLDSYRRSAVRGQVDVLTSIYAHTIAGYLVDYLEAMDIVEEEVEYGLEITKSVMGVEPRGIWTPEMAFSMKLVDLYSDLGLEYTVLDEKCHLSKSSGDRATHLEPYVVRGSSGELVVFFRDTELSNILSFKNNFKSTANAWRSAYEYAYLIVERTRHGGVLTIALDGENWIIFSKNPSITAYYYEKLVEYLVKIQGKNYAKTTTLRDVIEKYNPRRVLTHIPTTTWLCGFTKWCGEVDKQALYWDKARRTYSEVKSYEEKYGKNKYSKRARWALWHALDSDYWWAEFWDPDYIDAWLNEAIKVLEESKAIA